MCHRQLKPGYNQNNPPRARPVDFWFRLATRDGVLTLPRWFAHACTFLIANIKSHCQVGDVVGVCRRQDGVRKALVGFYSEVAFVGGFY